MKHLNEILNLSNVHVVMSIFISIISSMRKISIRITNFYLSDEVSYSITSLL